MSMKPPPSRFASPRRLRPATLGERLQAPGLGELGLATVVRSALKPLLRRPAVYPAVLGGMGPLAGIGWEAKLLATLQRRLGSAFSDQSYPALLFLSYPVVDRTAAILGGGPMAAKVARQLRRELLLAYAVGCTHVIVVCNTAHHFVRQLLPPGLTLIDMPREATSDGDAILFATDGTLATGIYEREGTVLVKPDPATQQQLMRAIYDGVKAGNLALAADLLADAIERVGAGSELPIILGCTELPEAFAATPPQFQARWRHRVIDPVQRTVDRLLALLPPR